MKKQYHFLKILIISIFLLTIFCFTIFKITTIIYSDFYVNSLLKIFDSSKRVTPPFCYSAFSNSTFIMAIIVGIFYSFLLTFGSFLYEVSNKSDFLNLLKNLLNLYFLSIVISFGLGGVGYFLSLYYKIGVPENLNEFDVLISPTFFDALNFYYFSLVGLFISPVVFF